MALRNGKSFSNMYPPNIILQAAILTAGRAGVKYRFHSLDEICGATHKSVAVVHGPILIPLSCWKLHQMAKSCHCHDIAVINSDRSEQPPQSSIPTLLSIHPEEKILSKVNRKSIESQKSSN